MTRRKRKEDKEISIYINNKMLEKYKQLNIWE